MKVDLSTPDNVTQHLNIIYLVTPLMTSTRIDQYQSSSLNYQTPDIMHAFRMRLDTTMMHQHCSTHTFDTPTDSVHLQESIHIMQRRPNTAHLDCRTPTKDQHHPTTLLILQQTRLIKMKRYIAHSLPFIVISYINGGSSTSTAIVQQQFKKSTSAWIQRHPAPAGTPDPTNYLQSSPINHHQTRLIKMKLHSLLE
ncbi:hypothetical protein SAMD00019534_095350, partial [Acytostelium subglobosum LB1]|uniref:hypothetical protein n=1 Tax=Acytostelium subglobosum LB1 TaxID=1410327 RepID=UPI0006450072